MTVEELIRELSSYPKDAIVTVWDQHKRDWYPVHYSYDYLTSNETMTVRIGNDD